MTAVSITPANVLPSSDAVLTMGTGNAAIAAGKSVYFDSTTNKYGLFDADSATAAVRTLAGVCVAACNADGAPMVVQTGGSLAIGGTVVAGTAYCGGATAGDIAPMADLVAGSGWYIQILGVATTTGIILIKIANAGVAE